MLIRVLLGWRHAKLSIQLLVFMNLMKSCLYLHLFVDGFSGSDPFSIKLPISPPQ